MLRSRAFAGTLAFLCTVFSAFTPTTPASAQIGNEPSDTPAVKTAVETAIAGVPVPAAAGVSQTTQAAMQRQAAAPPRRPRPQHELETPDRSQLQPNPDAPAVSHYPLNPPTAPTHGPNAIHTPALSFDGATLADTGAFPPDSMGTVGPTQFIVFVNGRLRSFTKAGVADGVLNADPDVFFAPVMTPLGGSVVLNFTSDPQIRYDRFTSRWFMSIIDVPCTNGSCSATAANRWLLAVSDAASNGTITASTNWTLLQFQPDPGTNFCDYPSLGIDVNALYVGCNMFSSAGSFVGTNGYVIQKTSALGAGPLVVTRFANIGTATTGPAAPRGVDNFDPTATTGYFVGADNGVFSRLVFRQVSNPGSATPTISANINVTVPTTGATNPVEHAGNTGGNSGRLDSLDDRLFAAMIRNGRLWTAHNLRVNTSGVANTSATARKAARWYEFQNLDTTPTLVQSGTVYDNAATLAAALQYWIPTAAVTGQGHAVLGFSMAGTPSGATPAFVGRLAGDTLGTMTGPPTGAAMLYGTTAASYNPPSDTGGSSGRRWGDYSFTVVDPLDDMSVWTVQEYNQAANSYSVRVGKLLAPPPATPNCSTTPIDFSAGTGTVVITATSSGGSGFYDPGANLPAPALPFSHIAATVTSATVNSVSYNSPTQVTLNITASSAGPRDVTITNPDGQSVTASGCINVTGGVPTTHVVTPSVSGGNGTIAPSTPQTVNDGATTSFTLTPNGGYRIASVAGTCGGNLSGSTYTTSAVTADCTVIASFAVNTHVVTPSVSGGNGTIAPSTPQTVNDGATSSFTLTPNGGYHIASVAGTCGGNLSGSVYTTNPVSADCTVIASFAADSSSRVCSGPIGHAIANTLNGTSINWISGAIVDTDPATGYDLNLYNSSGLSAWWNNSPPISAGVAATTSSANYTVLATGATVGPASTWSRTNGAMTAFRAGVDGYLGFRFDCSSIGGSTCYGYLHLTTTGTTGFPATIADYCYDNSGAAITVQAAPAPVALGKAFAPASVPVATPSTLTLTLGNPNASAATLTAALTDTFPSGLVVASPANAATTCTGGTVSATAGSGSIALSSGAQIPASGSCTVTASVQAATAGSYVNTIAVGALQTSAGNNMSAASATLTVTPAPLAPTLGKTFAPTSVQVATPSTLTLTLGNPNASAVALTAALTDTLPSGLVVASPANAATTCTSGTVSATAGTGSVTLSSGAQIPASGSCTVTVKVQAATAGSYVNTIAAGALQTGAGNNATAATATLTVTPAPVAPTLAKAFAPTSVPVATPSTLTLTLGNPNASALALTSVLTDTLPAGLVVASPANAATTCTGGTVSATAGTSSVTLSSGAQIPASGSCTVTVKVQAATAGSYVNTIAAGALQTGAGNNASAATATLTVTPPVITDRIFCDGFDGVACAGSSALQDGHGDSLTAYLLRGGALFAGNDSR